jgi:thiol-disulfide isomerase/thioredoxin
MPLQQGGQSFTLHATVKPPVKSGKGLPFLLLLAASAAASALLALAAQTPPTAKVKTATVEVREGMSPSSPVVKVLKHGAPVVVGLELQLGANDWCEISEPGSGTRLGYVPCQALDRPAPTAAEQAQLGGGTGAGVEVLLGKASPTRAPASRAARRILAPVERDRRFPAADITAPDFALRALDGQAHALSEKRGHYVLLDFWATWCGPCRAEMPQLERLQREYPGHELEVVGIDAGEAPDRVRRFVERSGYTFTILLDPQGEAAALYNAEAIPTLVVVDPSGKVRFYDSGAYGLGELRSVLARVGLR